MTETYSSFADVCALFYDLCEDPKAVAQFVHAHSRTTDNDYALFVGGFFNVARELHALGLQLDVVDYSDDMVDEGRRRLPELSVRQADLRELPQSESYSLVLVIGRVFTHMITGNDVQRALKSCRGALRTGGRLFLDNYEDSRIGRTPYFNAPLQFERDGKVLRRSSTTRLVSESPHVVDWSAVYELQQDGQTKSFSDSMLHRAFSRPEIRELLHLEKFRVLDQGDNFDDTSFYTLAEAV